MKLQNWGLVVFLLAATVILARPVEARARWTTAEAIAWNTKQPWFLGANYVPSDAINELEMWQKASFDPKRIDQEFGWAQGVGMNAMRVFLHNALWDQDPEGFKQRMNQFLDIAERHKIRIMFVLFDSCWDPDYRMGPQRAPTPGVHNSGWVQAPGGRILVDPSKYPALKAYVEGVVGAFAHDNRVFAWDVWNEADNPGGGNYRDNPTDKFERVKILLPQVFEWARNKDPIQPLTSGLWHDKDWSPSAHLNAIEQIQLDQSDILSFHDYSWPEEFESRIKQLTPYGRPVICTEYMARGMGSTFDTIAPIGKRANIGMINWGFVAGKTQTTLPWDSWVKPYTFKVDPPPIWFHDVFHTDGIPYRQREVQILKALSSAPKGIVPERY